MGGNTDNLYPLYLIAAYLGEEEALYFAWQSFYTVWLGYLAIPGIIVSIYQLVTWNVDTVLIPLFGFIVSLWITLMNQMWKRKEAEIIYYLNLKNFKAHSIERNDYECESIVNKITNEIEKMSFKSVIARTIFFSFPLILFGFGLIAAAFIGFRIWNQTNDSVGNNILVGSINGITIIVLNQIYNYLAAVLTNLENHRYENEWENSYAVKVYAFQFVNCYISLFAIAFYSEDINDLAFSVGSIFVVKQFLSTFLNLGIPYIMHKWGMRTVEQGLMAGNEFPPPSEERNKNISLEKQYQMPGPEDPLNKYCSMVIQVGYITMFSTCFPLASLLAFLHNLMALKGEISLNLYIVRRPLADTVNSIGIWKEILDVQNNKNFIVSGYCFHCS